MSESQRPGSNKAWHASADELTKYMLNLTVQLTPVQKKLIEATMKHEGAGMLSSPDELQLLQNIVRMTNAKKTLDIESVVYKYENHANGGYKYTSLGVFTGYSALTIALALPADGRVVALDVNDEFASVGKPYWKEAGVDSKIDLRIAPAADSLKALVDNGESGTFDFAFIDADKPSYLTYFEYCLQLLRPNGVIIVDNVLWKGKVVLDPSEDKGKDTGFIRAFNKAVAADPRVHVSMINIGDGITIALKK